MNSWSSQNSFEESMFSISGHSSDCDDTKVESKYTYPRSLIRDPNHSLGINRDSFDGFNDSILITPPGSPMWNDRSSSGDRPIDIDAIKWEGPLALEPPAADVRFSMEGLYELYQDDKTPFNNPNNRLSHARLEAVACFLLNVVLCTNVFMLTRLVRAGETPTSELLLRYLIQRIINIGSIGFITALFSGPDTYKSLNVHIENLLINAVIHNYPFVDVLKYIAIHIGMSFAAAIFSFGVYYGNINDVPTQDLVDRMFSINCDYGGYSYTIVGIMAHIVIALGYTILTIQTTSINSRQRAVQKSLIMFFASMTFGTVAGPIGFVWMHWIMYICLLVIRNDFAQFNPSIFTSNAILILFILLAYPIVAIKVKSSWKTKYLRYIEYGHL